MGDYCITSCPAKCCHVGKLFISEATVKKFNLNATKRPDGYYDLVIEGGCPLLKDNKCTVHKDPLRPSMCGQYPFFDRSAKVLLASSCKAVASGMFTQELKKLDDAGVKWDIQ